MGRCASAPRPTRFGGIGGLCLAQGLRRVGVDVTVYERTHSRDDWLQGHRIHINPRGSEALRDCLAPENWQAFLRTVSPGESFAFVTEDLRDLLVLDPEFLGGDPDPAHQHYGVSRIKLREVLLTGLDGVVRHGKVFERYERTADGRVVAHFADGSSAVGDVLVGADAIHNMTPMAGIGANTALRDASLLCRRLIAVRDGRAGLVPAVREYERQMIDYGFAAVKQSLRNAKQAANPRGRRVFRTVLRTAAAVPPLKRAMFGKIGQ